MLIFFFNMVYFSNKTSESDHERDTNGTNFAVIKHVSDVELISKSKNSFFSVRFKISNV